MEQILIVYLVMIRVYNVVRPNVYNVKVKIEKLVIVTLKYVYV